MITADSMGHSWLSATHEARRAYVAAACQGCSERGVGHASPETVLAGLNAYFARTGNHKWKVSHGFGIIFGAVSRGHDYHLFLDPT